MAAGFSGSGSRLLLTPHPSFDGEVRVVEWPDLRPIASVTAHDFGLPDDRLDLHGCFLQDDAVLLKTYEAGIVLADGDLTPRARVQLGDDENLDYELESLCRLGPDTFATVRWREGKGSTEVWALVQAGWGTARSTRSPASSELSSSHPASRSSSHPTAGRTERGPR